MSCLGHLQVPHTSKPWATAVCDCVLCCPGMWDRTVGPKATTAQGCQCPGRPLLPWLAGPVHGQAQQGCLAAVQTAHRRVLLEPALA